MKNITLRANEQLIEQARLFAKSRDTALNALFCGWLKQFTAQIADAKAFDALMTRLKHVQVGRRFSRGEMNQWLRGVRNLSMKEMFSRGGSPC